MKKKAEPKAKSKAKKTKVETTTKKKVEVKAKAKKAKAKATKVKKAKAKAKAKPKARARAVVARRAAGKEAVERIPQAPAGAGEALAAQEAVESAKYFTGGPAESARQLPVSLPYEYGEERIVLLVRDPETVFAYWEVPSPRLEREQARHGRDARLCVRIYDVTGVVFDGTNATSILDQDVYERVGSWYFRLDRPAHTFCADIGLRTADGRFVMIARSNTASVPRGDVSDVTDEEWMLLEEEFLKLYGAGILGGMRGGLSSPQMQELLRQRRLLEISSPGASARRRQAKR